MGCFSPCSPPREGRTSPPQGDASVGWFWGMKCPLFPLLDTRDGISDSGNRAQSYTGRGFEGVFKVR